MIQPQNLRIGSVLRDREGRICKVEHIDLLEFKAPAIVGAMTSLPHSPIELTEDVLMACGAVDNNYSFDLKAGAKKISLRWFSKIVETGVRQGFYCKKYRHIKYLHELQDLFRALTGKELQIDLEKLNQTKCTNTSK